MGRSQRHHLENYGTTSAGFVHAQGAIAPSILAQAGVATPEYGVLEFSQAKESGGMGWIVPVGDPGGPLSGSTLSGAIPEGAPPPPNPTPPSPQPGPEPAPGEEPTLNSINPSSARIGSADVTMNVTGQRFTETSLIYFNGGAEQTIYYDAGKLSTVVKPSTASVPGSYPVWVQQGSYQTTQKMFTFTDPQISQHPTQPGGERTLPAGPFAIVDVRWDDTLGQLIFQLEDDASGFLRNGDDVLVEATGSSQVNGVYTVQNVAGPEFGIEMPSSPIAASITNKGRLTINGEA
jgi:hypothetical protein